MSTEIERKFLVRDPSVIRDQPGTRIHQGYLSRDPDRTVRVRVTDTGATLTVKGRTTDAQRQEFEYPVPLADGEALLRLCAEPVVDKIRYRLNHAGRTWEVDVFEGANAGLVTAEVELPSVDAVVSIPDWIGAEVTGDPRYYNANLGSASGHEGPRPG